MQNFYPTPYFYFFPAADVSRAARLALALLLACLAAGAFSVRSVFPAPQSPPSASYLNITLPTGKTLRLPVQIINGQRYGTLPALASSFPGGRALEWEIVFKTERLRFAPSSFFVALESGGEERIAQMNMPVISLVGKPLAPVPQFFHALPALGVYAVRTDDSGIALSMTGQKSAPVAVPRVSANAFPAPVPSDAPQPGRYALPPGLDRTAALSGEPAAPLAGTIAAAAAQHEQSAGAITSLTVYRKDSITQIRFTANCDISSFQKPETENNDVIVRFGDLDNATRDLSPLSAVFPVQSVIVEKIRSTLVFRIRLTKTPSACTARRIGSRKVAVDIVVAVDNTLKSEAKPRPKPADPAGQWKLDAVVLDPGHGGADEGATGVSGVREKDITLAIALKTRGYLREMLPDVKVIMTRTTDTFIALDRRGQIANEAGGKLFISIHCNSMPAKPHPAHGFETYILRPGRNDEAIAVAERENAAVKFEKKTGKAPASEEQIIVATMAQAAFVRFSEKFAAIVQAEMKKATSLFPRGVNQAGFLVLVGASMPNVLFESAFLSNETDEKFIASEAGIAKTARALANAVRLYARDYAEAVRK